MESIFGIHEQALRVRTMRSELLANNLANADTPNYKARDIDWRQMLNQSKDELQMVPSGKPDLVRTDARHIAASADFTTSDFLKYRMPTQPALDGNTVETHIEKAQFMENAMQQQATLNFIDGKIKGIRGALRGE
ncbi:flagellar basal body rod protein FlgB [Galenea microaerophila]